MWWRQKERLSLKSLIILPKIKICYQSVVYTKPRISIESTLGGKARNSVTKTQVIEHNLATTLVHTKARTIHFETSKDPK